MDEGLQIQEETEEDAMISVGAVRRDCEKVAELKIIHYKQ
jgi:hypothetical protein